jgi:N-acyl-D-aspartate/D-glutamate deacylase
MSKPAHDRVFRNALIYDGSGAPPFMGDIAIDGERIAVVGLCGAVSPGGEETDLRGLALSPGFIDAHTHGRISPRCFVDLVVFDPAHIIDRATYESPREPSDGIAMVLVNGALSFKAGAAVGARAGRLIGGNSPPH